MGIILTIISILGSFTSIYAFVDSIKLKSIRNIITYGILICTSVVSGVCFTLYQRETDAQIKLEKRKETVRAEAKALLENVPSYIDYYNPGENEGLLLGTLSLLEKKKIYFRKLTKYSKWKLFRKSKIQIMNLIHLREENRWKSLEILLLDF